MGCRKLTESIALSNDTPPPTSVLSSVTVAFVNAPADLAAVQAIDKPLSSQGVSSIVEGSFSGKVVQ